VLLKTPWVYQRINTYLLHLLGEYFSKKNNLFIKCVFIPIIFNDNFYFAIDREKLLYFKPMFKEYKLFSHIFENFPSFKKILENISKSKHYILPPYDINHFSICSSNCLCQLCYYTQSNISQKNIFLKRQCCANHF